MGILCEEEVIEYGNRTYYKVNNKYYTLYRLAKIYDIPYMTLYMRVKKNKIPYMTALKMGEGQKRNKEYENGLTITEMAYNLGKKYQDLYLYAFRRGITVVEAYNKLNR